jgi:hypothetical protein
MVPTPHLLLLLFYLNRAPLSLSLSPNAMARVLLAAIFAALCLVELASGQLTSPGPSPVSAIAACAVGGSTGAITVASPDDSVDYLFWGDGDLGRASPTASRD